ncbi:MAG TPA: GGDEF domain-containing protein [Verrucomicrobiae bacterium]|nr:GGDEF domain-containing protein [Verrucomicrobiae bacterium]
MTQEQNPADWAEDRYEKQRRQGFPWLRFAPALEKEYRDSFVEMNMARIRLAGTVALGAVVAFIVMDEGFGMNLESRLGDFLLLAFCMPSALIPLAATFLPKWRPYLLRMIQVGVAGVSAGVLLVVMIGRGEHPWFPYESLLLVTAYIYFVSGLLFFQAMACGMALWVAFVFTNSTLQQPDVLLYEGYYLLIANVLGWLGLYLLDRQARTEFLLRRELHHHAVTDSVTGLLNRRAFNAHLETAWAQAQRGLTSIGLILIDLDHFKVVNDTGGHQFGDNALNHVGRLLKGCALRPLDAAGRYGGDELIAVWFGVDGNWLQKIAKDLPSRLDGLECGSGESLLKVGISGGAVLAWPRPGLTVHDAVKAADELLYEMKRTARGTIGYKVLRPLHAVDVRTDAA